MLTPEFSANLFEIGIRILKSHNRNSDIDFPSHKFPKLRTRLEILIHRFQSQLIHNQVQNIQPINPTNIQPINPTNIQPINSKIRMNQRCKFQLTYSNPQISPLDPRLLFFQFQIKFLTMQSRLTHSKSNYVRILEF